MVPSHPTLLLPNNAEYFSCKVNTLYNSNYDIVWSFKYSVSGTQLEYGIGTGLTCINPPPDDYSDNPLPGQYLCTPVINQSLFTPTIIILSGGVTTSYTPYSLISVSIDTVGACGLSSAFRPGVSASSLSSNALTIRDISNNVILYQPVSSSIFDANQNHIIRCIYSNSNRTLQVDYRNENNLDFSTIALCSLDYYIINNDNLDLVSPCVSFCSPISSLQEPSFVHLYNLHHEGVRDNIDVEILTSTFVS